jgi:hypothetical protein
MGRDVDGKCQVIVAVDAFGTVAKPDKQRNS